MRYLIGSVVTFVLTLFLTWLYGQTTFSDDAIYMVQDLCSHLGIYGVENVQDFYLYTVLCISFIVSAPIVWFITRLIQRRRP